MTRTSDSGYSLVELVVALALLGIVALAVQGGLHFGGRVWQRTQDRTTSLNDLVTGHAVLRDLIAHSLPRQKGRYVRFSGAPLTMEFDADPPLAFQAHGTAHVRLSIVGAGPQAKLTLSMQSIARPAVAQKVELANGVPSLRFGYLDASSSVPTWLAFWRDRNQSPDAIRITSDDPTRWPTLIIRPIISQSATCALDPVLMTCRDQ